MMSEWTIFESTCKLSQNTIFELSDGEGGPGYVMWVQPPLSVTKRSVPRLKDVLSVFFGQKELAFEVGQPVFLVLGEVQGDRVVLPGDRILHHLRLRHHQRALRMDARQHRVLRPGKTVLALGPQVNGSRLCLDHWEGVGGGERWLRRKLGVRSRKAIGDLARRVHRGWTGRRL